MCSSRIKVPVGIFSWQINLSGFVFFFNFEKNSAEDSYSIAMMPFSNFRQNVLMVKYLLLNAKHSYLKQHMYVVEENKREKQ